MNSILDNKVSHITPKSTDSSSKCFAYLTLNQMSQLLAALNKVQESVKKGIKREFLWCDSFSLKFFFLHPSSTIQFEVLIH